ncbi:MAG: HEPN domain-containing protein [Polaribacter sp.]
MKNENQEDYINYRLQRSKESYEESLILAREERWNAVINRLYYACFYSVIALLIKNNIETRSHDGARTQFGLHFVKTEKINRSLGKLFSKLFDYRQKGDYGDMFDFDEELTKPLITEVKLFISTIENLLNKSK